MSLRGGATIFWKALKDLNSQKGLFHCDVCGAKSPKACRTFGQERTRRARRVSSRKADANQSDDLLGEISLKRIAGSRVDYGFSTDSMRVCDSVSHCGNTLNFEAKKSFRWLFAVQYLDRHMLGGEVAVVRFQAQP
jgi:hypothetical protein